MKGIVNWYSDIKKRGLIVGEDGKDIMVYEKDLPFLTILHAGENIEYSVVKTIHGLKATKIKK
jgi:cold shock CspA family protein